MAVSNPNLIRAISEYWNIHIHDLAIAKYPVGSVEFFQELATYRFDKLAYLPRLAQFPTHRGKRLLEVGCGLGLDLVRFAEHGAIVTGIDLAQNSIDLAKRHFAFRSVTGDLRVMDGEHLEFDDCSFDAAYAHGVLQYTADSEKMIAEIKRVLKPGGNALLMVYNRYSWLHFMSRVFRVGLEHQDAPVLNMFSIPQFKKMLNGFSQVEIIPERFPVPTRLHHGMKAALFNNVFVSLFNCLPVRIVRPLGWHLVAKAIR